MCYEKRINLYLSKKRIEREREKDKEVKERGAKKEDVDK